MGKSPAKIWSKTMQNNTPSQDMRNSQKLAVNSPCKIAPQVVMTPGQSTNVKVVIRLRPLNEREKCKITPLAD